MKDLFGDEITLDERNNDQVELACTRTNRQGEGDYTFAILDGKKARKLARKLNRWAEGR